LPGCPNSTESGCPDHAPGLAAFARDPAAYEAALAPLRPVRLHVVTTGVLAESPACDGSMTCSCERCVGDRAARTAHGGGPQPWEPRPARERRAA
jgi:hypothetical protein